MVYGVIQEIIQPVLNQMQLYPNHNQVRIYKIYKHLIGIKG